MAFATLLHRHLHLRGLISDQLRVSVLDERVIRVAIKPAFAGLGGGDHGMSGGVRVFGGVLVRRAVAAKGRAAGLAGPQMNPARADLDAFGAFEDFGKFDFADRVDVLAIPVVHDFSFSDSCTPAMAMLPSPTAAAQRLTEPERTSPTAKMPGRLVSSATG